LADDHESELRTDPGSLIAAISNLVYRCWLCGLGSKCPKEVMMFRPRSRLAFIFITFIISFAGSCPPPVGSITVTTRPIPNWCGGEVTIKGTGFPPGHIIEIYFQSLPGRSTSDQIFDSLHTADAQGRFESTHNVRCQTWENKKWPNVIVVAKDKDAEVSQYPFTGVDSGIWVCRC
jgi:hypothetical protein